MPRIVSPRAPLAALPWIVLPVLAACGGAQAPATPGSPPAVGAGAVGSGRQSPAEPPPVPSAETGFLLLRRGDLKGAEPHLAGALAGAPRDPRILEALGAIYARTDRYRQAEESLRAALAVAPASPGAHLGLATVYIDTGRYDEALAELAEVRRLDPDNGTALLKEALLEARRGEQERAEASARKVLERRPDQPEAHYVLGLVALQRGVLDDAESEMLRVRERAPDHLGALSHLVTIAARRGRRRQAEDLRRAYQAALLRRRVEERVRGHRMKGVEAFNRQDYGAALQEFQAIAREDPRDPQVHLHMGSTYIGLGRLDEGRAALEECLRLDPRNERAFAELGRLHALAHRFDEAVTALEKAVAANPEFPEPHYYLAGIYMARGDAGRSQSELRRFEELRSRSRGAATEVIPQYEEGE